MSENFLSEAFKDLAFLNEDTFDFSREGAEELKKFMDDDSFTETETIIDPEAETEEDLEDSYVGKAILSCDVCHSMIYKDPSDVIIDEETQLANVGEECPYCANPEGFKIIGQVAEFDLDDEDDSEESKEVEQEVEVSDEEEEELTEAKSRDKGSSNIKKLKKAYPDLNLTEAAADLTSIPGTVANALKKEMDNLKDAKSFKDLKSKMVKIIDDSEDIPETSKAALKDKLSKATNLSALGTWMTGLKVESLKEGFERVDIETDREKMSMTSDDKGKVTVTTEPKEEEVEVESSEVIEPVSDEMKAEIKSNSTEEDEMSDEEVEFDEFDEESFDELEENYLKKVYDNVSSYKTSSVKVNGNSLILEGIITFDSGKKASTSFLFEASHKTARGKLKFIGQNKQITESNKSFVITGSIQDKKLLTEALTYNYKVKGYKDRIYGTVKK